MPFIIDHRAHALPPNHEVAVRAVPISSYAVATIEEARQHVFGIAEDSLGIGDLRAVTFCREVAVTDGAQSIGPLPDGTTIEVRPVTYSELATLASHTLRPDIADGRHAADEIISSYNAHQEG